MTPTPRRGRKWRSHSRYSQLFTRYLRSAHACATRENGLCRYCSRKPGGAAQVWVGSGGLLCPLNDEVRRVAGLDSFSDIERAGR